MLRILFSIYVWLVCFVWMAFLAIATFILLPIFPYRRTHNWIAAPGFVWCVRLTFSKLRVTYDPAFDKNRLSVFCMNHTNLLDAHVASAAIPHAFCGLMNAWQFKIPFYGWLMGLSKGIPVHKKPAKELLQDITESAKDRLKQGFSILVFPEAHRTLDGKVHKFRRGVFMMARGARYPVVPIAVRGLFNVNQRGSLKFKPGKIDVYVGPQVETKGLSDEAIDEVAVKFQKTISNFVASES